MNEFCPCPLCSHPDTEAIRTSDKRLYHLCNKCKLIFLDGKLLPTPDEEATRYRQHHNSLEDEGYVQFLEKVLKPASQYLHPGMKTLDYGCGPEPVLSQLLGLRYQTESNYYDPFFFPRLPDRRYEMIFSTETFEHFFQPASELHKLHSLLSTGGYLCVMTQLWMSTRDFEQWWYRRDPTHVCFYHRQSFEMIAQMWKMKMVFSDQKSVFILQKT